jgi:acyl-coenzyme A thioesterase PaaI-like protein
MDGVPEIGDHNMVGDMQVASLLVSKERCLMRAPLNAAVQNKAGVASVAMMLTMIDVGGSDPALAACHPDWTATQDLSVHGGPWLTAGPIVVDNHLARVGTKVVIVTAKVYDGQGLHHFEEIQDAIDGERLPLAATSLLTFARIPRTAAREIGDEYNPNNWVGEVRERPGDGHPQGTLYSRLGLQTLDAANGVLDLERTSYVVNSIGTINGGAQAIQIEAAAEAMRPGLVACDLEVHYLSQLNAGPSRSRGRVIRDAADHSVIEIELVDAGHGDQVLTLATVTLRKR